MKTSTRLLAATGGIVALVAIAWAFAPRPIDVEAAQVTTGPFRTTVDEDGKTRLRDRYIVSAPLAGEVARLAAREGDSVAADAVVAVMTPMLPALLDERSLSEQQLHLEGTVAQMQRAQARLEGARVTLAHARAEVRRSEQLAAQGFVAATKLDLDRLTAQAAEKDLEAVAQEHHAATHDVEQARAALVAVQRPTAPGARSFALRAPIAGKVLRVAQRSEAVVSLGTPLLELGDLSNLEIVAELLTTDALGAGVGSRVIVERWGGPHDLEGRVRLVEPGAFTKVSALGIEEQRVNVVIDITSPRAQWQALGDGYRVGVRIVTRDLVRVVQVPIGAVFPRTDGAGMAVLVLAGGRARLRGVDVGARNASTAWIRRGLEPGEQVIVYPPPAVEDGARVAPRRV